jgi:hypothetical protein
MNKRLLAAAITGAIAGFGLLPAVASADTRVMGSALTLPYQGGVCTNNCLSFQQAQVGGASPNPITSPANALVTQWAVRTGDPDALYTLRILRPTATLNTYLGAGSSAAPQAVPPGTTDSIITYPVTNALQIKKGDHIGVFQTGNADGGLPQNTTNGITGNVIANNFAGLPADTAQAPFIPDAQHELLLQATIKFCNVPNVKKKKLSVAKSRLAAGDCSAKVVRKETQKAKFRGKVLKQKLAPGETAIPGTAVKIVIAKKAK